MINSTSLVPPSDPQLNLTHFGFSEESVQIKEELRIIFNEIQNIIGGVKSGIQTQITKVLEEIATECMNEDWDGYGAKPISDDACKALLGFISQIEPSLPVPEVVPESDGDIGLEWHVNNNRWLILSFHSREVVHYAARLDEYSKNDGILRLDQKQTRFLIELVRLILD